MAYPFPSWDPASWWGGRQVGGYWQAKPGAWAQAMSSALGQRLPPDITDWLSNQGWRLAGLFNPIQAREVGRGLPRTNVGDWIESFTRQKQPFDFAGARTALREAASGTSTTERGWQEGMRQNPRSAMDVIMTALQMNPFLANFMSQRADESLREYEALGQGAGTMSFMEWLSRRMRV